MRLLRRLAGTHRSSRDGEMCVQKSCVSQANCAQFDANVRCSPRNKFVEFTHARPKSRALHHWPKHDTNNGSCCNKVVEFTHALQAALALLGPNTTQTTATAATNPWNIPTLFPKSRYALHTIGPNTTQIPATAATNSWNPTSVAAELSRVESS